MKRILLGLFLVSFVIFYLYFKPNPHGQDVPWIATRGSQFPNKMVSLPFFEVESFEETQNEELFLTFERENIEKPQEEKMENKIDDTKSNTAIQTTGTNKTKNTVDSWKGVDDNQTRSNNDLASNQENDKYVLEPLNEDILCPAKFALIAIQDKSFDRVIQIISAARQVNIESNFFGGIANVSTCEQNDLFQRFQGHTAVILQGQQIKEEIKQNCSLEFIRNHKLLVLLFLRSNLLDEIIDNEITRIKNSNHCFNQKCTGELLMPLHLDGEALKRDLQALYDTQKELIQIVQKLPNPTMQIMYEDLYESDHIFSEMFRFLGCKYRSLSPFLRPQAFKQSEIIANYTQIIQLFTNSTFRQYFQQYSYVFS